MKNNELKNNIVYIECVDILKNETDFENGLIRLMELDKNYPEEKEMIEQAIAKFQVKMA